MGLLKGKEKGFQQYEIYSQGVLLQERNNGPYFLCQIYIGTTYFHNAFSELYNKLLEIYIHAYVGMDIMSMNHFTHKKQFKENPQITLQACI